MVKTPKISKTNQSKDNEKNFLFHGLRESTNKKNRRPNNIY